MVSSRFEASQAGMRVFPAHLHLGRRLVQPSPLGGRNNLEHCSISYSMARSNRFGKLTETPIRPAPLPHTCKLEIDHRMRALGPLKVGITVLLVSLSMQVPRSVVDPR